MAQKLKKALTMTDLLRIKRKLYEFEGEWEEAFGRPEQGGIWFIWGKSGNGKTSFVLQLCKELTRHGKVGYNSLEEGRALTIQNSLVRVGMCDVGKNFVLLQDTMEELDIRLKRRRAPDIVIIDSFQEAHLSIKEYHEFCSHHPKKLLIFISQTEGCQPMGRDAQAAIFIASLKIWVEGYRAISKGRYYGNRGYYNIWKERADKYWCNHTGEK